ncbi:MAG: hypothetical protein ACPG7F_06095 [Aggregatilineales bacterium]
MAVLILVVLSASFTQAQDDIILLTPQPITLRNLKWSNDGQLLVFRDNCCDDTGIITIEANWYTYDVTTETLTQDNSWGLAPQLAVAEMYSAGITDDHFNFMSPDERYVFYSADVPEDDYQLRLYDRQQGMFLNLPFFDMARASGTDRFNAWWSEDSTALITRLTPITPYELVSGYFYISDYDAGFANTQFIELYDAEINGDEYGFSRIYDLSPDGRHVLIGAAKRGERGGRILFYNPQIPTDSLIISPSEVSMPNIYVARFLEGDNHRIIYLNESGIHIYDKTTGASELVRDDINSIVWDGMLFAPGGKHLALVEDDQVYVVDLTDDLPD